MPLTTETTAVEEAEAAAEAVRQAAARSARDWPDAVAYRDVVQSPAAAFTDPELASGTVRLDRRGLPLAYTGRFAIVFRLATGAARGGDWAVRCFTSPEPAAAGARAAHYAALSDHLDRLRAAGDPAADAFVRFRYVPEGIRVGAGRYPVLAMRWAEGETLLRFVEARRHDPAALTRAAAALGRLLADLERAGIAHGDWQHDNVLVSDDGARVTLVDYDGVRLPGAVSAAPERGHPNYQHPARTADPSAAGGSPDRFSCHVLQTALLALAADPTLWDTFADGDSLLFKAADFADPDGSTVFATLRLIAVSSGALRLALTLLESACRADGLGSVPPPLALEAPALVKESQPAGHAWCSETGSAHDIGAAEVLWGGTDRALGETRSELTRNLTQYVETARKMQALVQRYERQNLSGLRLLLGSLGFMFLASSSQPVASVVLSLLAVATLLGAYRFWPTTMASAAVADIEKKLQNEADGLNGLRWQLNFELKGIDKDPANGSPLAYAGRALGAVRFAEVGWGRWSLDASDLEDLDRAGITRLSQVTADAVASLRPTVREAVVELRGEIVEAAQVGYRTVAARRRDLREQLAEIDRAREGFASAREEIEKVARNVGDASFVRFLGRICGLA